MKKISYICDMCGQDATINYYEICFKQNQDHNGKITTAAAARNCSSFMSRLAENQSIYCEKCITKIENYEEKLNKEIYNIDLHTIFTLNKNGLDKE